MLFGSLLQVAFLGLIVWAIARALGRRRSDGEQLDQAASVRRLFVYGLLFVSVMLSAVGASLALQELDEVVFGDAGDDRSALAFGLAVVVVASPAAVLLWRHVRRQLAESLGERESFGWFAYMNLTLAVSLIVTTVFAQQFLEAVSGVESFELGSAAPVVVWGAVWALHWSQLRADFGLAGDTHLAAGTVVGLVTVSIGLGGMVFVAGDGLYTAVVERVPRGHHDPELRRWIIATGIGAAVWWWHWFRRYVAAERTALWHVCVVLVGALGGLVATLGAGATIVYWTLVWFLGHPTETLSSFHFEYVPATAGAVLIVGTLVWQYHRIVLQRRPDVTRSEPLRAYDYLGAGAGLVAMVVGATVGLVAFFEAVTPEPAGTQTLIANQLILTGTLAVIGGPLWLAFWGRIGRQAALDASETRSVVRRTYLIALFGVGGVVALVSLISALFVAFDDLLNTRLGGQTIRSARIGISLVASVTGVAWGHLTIYRSDRRTLESSAPGTVGPTRHLVLVAPRDTELADRLAAATGAVIDASHDTTHTVTPDIDVEEIAARIEQAGTTHVAVIVDVDDVKVIPLQA